MSFKMCEVQFSFLLPTKLTIVYMYDYSYWMSLFKNVSVCSNLLKYFTYNHQLEMQGQIDFNL